MLDKSEAFSQKLLERDNGGTYEPTEFSGIDGVTRSQANQSDLANEIKSTYDIKMGSLSNKHDSMHSSHLLIRASTDNKRYTMGPTANPIGAIALTNRFS